MTSRERIIGTLRCEPTDRAPYGVGIGFYPWGSTLDRWKEESGIEDLWPPAYFGYDREFEVVPVNCGPCPAFESRVMEEDDEYVISTDFRGMTVRNRRDGGSMPEFLACPVKAADDWERYKAERLRLETIEERVAGLDDFVRAHSSDVPVQVGTFPWGVFGTPRDLLGVEEFLVGFYTQPDLIRDIMETYTDLWLRLYSVVAARMQIDHVHIWEDMCGRNGSLISMAMVNDFMMPCYDRIASFAAAHDVPLFSVDSDGLVDELIPVMMRHGVNSFLPFEVQAGNDVVEYRRLYPGLGIIGGLDKNALADRAPMEAMHRELDRAETMLGGGGYIPGFDHLIPPNVPWSKWCSFMDSLKKLIGV